MNVWRTAAAATAAALALGLRAPDVPAAPPGRPAAPARPPAARSPGPPPPRFNVILLTVASLRADRLGCYGASAPTPAIDTLASAGVRFERAYAASPSTTPSAATVLTGALPARHGLRHDLGGTLSDGVPTLAEIVRRAGYRTRAIVGSFHLDSDRGLDRGFELYDDAIAGTPKPPLGRARERRGHEIFSGALAFLDEMKGAARPAPFFLWLDFYDPHQDFDPPESVKNEHRDDLYQAEIAYLDGQVGALTAALRARHLLDRTVLVVAGIHGEGLGDHGEIGHGVYLYETTVRVPLIVAGPGGGAGRTVAEPVGLVDVMPTVLALAGVAAPSGLEGRALLPLPKSSPSRAGEASEPVKTPGTAAAPTTLPPDPRRLFIEAVQPHEAYGWSPLFAVVEGSRKIIGGKRLEAFDLAADPGEVHPLDPAPAWAAEMEVDGRNRLGSVDAPEVLRRRVTSLAEELSLPWAGHPTCVEKMNWPDPRDRVAINGQLFQARLDAEFGLPGRASRTALDVILPVDPANFTALELTLALALRNGDRAGAAQPLELMQCNYPTRGASYHYVAHLLQRDRDYTRAEKAFRIFALLEPDNEEPFYDMAALYAAQGKKDQAFENLKASIARGATDFEHIRNDPQLLSLRDDPRFADLVGPVQKTTRSPG